MKLPFFLIILSAQPIMSDCAEFRDTSKCSTITANPPGRGDQRGPRRNFRKSRSRLAPTLCPLPCSGLTVPPSLPATAGGRVRNGLHLKWLLSADFESSRSSPHPGCPELVSPVLAAMAVGRADSNQGRLSGRRCLGTCSWTDRQHLRKGLRG